MATDHGAVGREEGGEQLVAIRAAVLSDAEHALGNLLQRIHHVIRASRDGLGANADRLSGNLQDLEGLLELVFDYVSPIDLELRQTSSDSVAESLAAQLGTQAQADVTIENRLSLPLAVDRRLLSRSFQLLGRCLARERVVSPLSIGVMHNRESESVEWVIRMAADGIVISAADANLAWAVAGRLIELHGGELRCNGGAAETRLHVMLPLQGAPGP